ncbi:MAG: radical SAM protein [Alphaproteobacteria bacterium]
MGVDFSDLERLRKLTEAGEIIPTELAIETVFGCNAKCVMCFIDQPTARRKQVMKPELYRYIIDAMEPHKDGLEKFDLWALGEPLMDPHILDRVSYAKRKGYPNMALATNADMMDERLQKGLLDAGVDTFIISIDAVKPETHAAIRRGLDYDRVVRNCESMIRRRDEGGYRSRFLFRFVDQGTNHAEWPGFRDFWAPRISEDKKDNVVRYLMHNWGGYVGDKRELLGDRYSEAMERVPCNYVFESLIILADGRLSLCPADFLEGQFPFGKVPEQTPLEAFNSEEYKRHRRLHLAERKNDIRLCETCTILYSNGARDYLWEQKSHTFRIDSDGK